VLEKLSLRNRSVAVRKQVQNQVEYKAGYRNQSASAPQLEAKRVKLEVFELKQHKRSKDGPRSEFVVRVTGLRLAYLRRALSGS
jgi:hypothetical protein